MADRPRMITTTPLDFGWGENGTAAMWCQARLTTAMCIVPGFTCIIEECFGQVPTDDWVQASVGIVTTSLSATGNLAPETDTAVQIVIDPGETLTLGLSSVEGLRRLVERDRPGLELSFGYSKPRLQLLAPAVKHRVSLGEVEGSPSGIRLQLMHAFLAATLEARDQQENPRSLMSGFPPTCAEFLLRIAPRLALTRRIDWPHPNGRKATMSLLASTLRGVEVVDAHEVQAKAVFAGPICPVCLDPWASMNRNQPIATLSCGHAFCEACLWPAVRTRNGYDTQCPVCRSPFKQRKTLPPDAAI